MTTRTATRRPITLAAIAIMILGCGTSTEPGVGTAAPPSSAVPAPSSSGESSAPASSAPSVSPPPNANGIEDVLPTEGVLNAVRIRDDTVVAGGFSGPSFRSTIVVFDGRSWSVAQVPEAPGQVTGLAELDGRLIAVGNGLPDRRVGFIWESADGRTWQQVQVIENAALYDVVVGDGAAVAVGALLDEEMNATAAAWSSTDAMTWERADVEAAKGSSMGPVSPTPDGFATTGDRPLGSPRRVWSSTAGTSWTALDNDLSDQLLPVDLDYWSGSLALVGASGRSGDQHPIIALSLDGERWEHTTLSTDEGYASAVAVADERLVVAGVDADRLTLWSLTDGAWTGETIEAEGATISALSWDVDRGLIAVGARGGLHAVWSLGD